MECAALPEPALRSTSDERLVALTRGGEPRAFEEIVRRYRPALVRFAGGFLANGRAEDVVQEALIRSHRAMVSGDSEIQLRAWLFRIVHNGAISELRVTRSHEQLDERINGVAQPPELFERRERLDDVVRELKALPSNQRRALVKSELEGTSHDQIAAELGTTPGGVSQLIFRARTALRNAAGLLTPLPILRWIPRALGNEAGAAASAGGAGTGAVAAIGSGGAKIGATVAAAALAIGSGAALQGGQADRDSSKPDRTAIEVSHAAAGDAEAPRAVAAGTQVTPGAGITDFVTGANGSGSSSSALSGASGSADATPGTAVSESTSSNSVSSGGSSQTGSGSGASGGSASQPPTDSTTTHSSPPPPPPSQPREQRPPGGGTYDGSQPPPSGTQTQTQPPPPPPDGSTSYQLPLDGGAHMSGSYDSGGYLGGFDGTQPPPPDGSDPQPH